MNRLAPGIIQKINTTGGDYKMMDNINQLVSIKRTKTLIRLEIIPFRKCMLCYGLKSYRKLCRVSYECRQSGLQYLRSNAWMNEWSSACVCVCAQRLEKKPSILVRWKNKQLNNIETTNKRIMQLLFLTVHTSEQGIIRLWYNSSFKGKSTTRKCLKWPYKQHIFLLCCCVFILNIQIQHRTLQSLQSLSNLFLTLCYDCIACRVH